MNHGKYTHVATNKASGQSTFVYRDDHDGTWAENWMVCLKNPDTDWVIEPIKETPC